MSSSSDASRSGQFWLLTLAAGVALVLVALSMMLARSNQAIQSEIDNRQQYINQTIRISRLNTRFIQALANVSARTGDEQIRLLLADHGISFSANVMSPPDESGGDDEQAVEEPE